MEGRGNLQKTHCQATRAALGSTGRHWSTFLFHLFSMVWWVNVLLVFHVITAHFRWASGPPRFFIPCNLRWALLCVLLGSPLLFIGFAIVFLMGLGFILYILRVSPLFSNARHHCSIVLPFVFQWALRCFYWATFCFVMGPFILLLGLPCFLMGLSYVFYWVPLCFQILPLHSSIEFSFVL